MFTTMRHHFSSDLAIDLGTATTSIYASGRGIVVSEPSLVALNTTSGEIEAVGDDATEILGRTPGGVTAIRPMRDGVIADFDAAERMLAHFIRKARAHSGWLRPRLIIGVPSGISAVERQAVRDSARRARVGEVYLVEDAVAAAVGAGVPVSEATGSMVIDIGGGTTDIAVLSLAGVVYSRSLRIAGNEIDDAIVSHARRAHDLLIGERMAERVKIAIGSASRLDERRVMDVTGRHRHDGRPITVRMTDEEVRKAINEPVRAIAQAVQQVLEQVPPELSADLCDRGIILTGGGALLTNLDRRLQGQTGLPVCIAEHPLESVVRGAGKMLSDFKLLEKITLA